MFWNKKNKITDELNKKISAQKESYVLSFLTLICKKKYGDEWEDNIHMASIVSTLKLYPEIYEAIYNHSYQKLSPLLNEDGTGNRSCEFWKDLI